jgi:hypothetical protein
VDNKPETTFLEILEFRPPGKEKHCVDNKPDTTFLEIMEFRPLG